MPELPEVETIVRALRARITGKKIAEAVLLREKILFGIAPKEWCSFLQEQTICAVQRFGKYLHFQLASGKSLVSHLRMTGKYLYTDKSFTAKELEDHHIRFYLQFIDHSYLFYQDIRCFGTIRAYYPDQEIEEQRKVGLDPFSPLLTGDYLRQKATTRKLSIKNFLLDQRVISGLGNIYVCEALFKARINPFLSVQEITASQFSLLLEETRAILKVAINRRGTSVRDYRDPDQQAGSFQLLLTVYQREGEPCPACGKAVIRRRKQSQRSTFYCPLCQHVEDKPSPDLNDLNNHTLRIVRP